MINGYYQGKYSARFRDKSAVGDFNGLVKAGEEEYD